jgi:adenylate cyclase
VVLANCTSFHRTQVGVEPVETRLSSSARRQGIRPVQPIATCSADGTPNVTYLSIVHWLDADHVALSNQFFSKTKKNLEENAKAQLLVVEPATCRQFVLDLVFVRTELDGPVFERMKSRLEAIASQTGMAGVFRLRGADIYPVLQCTAWKNRPEDAAPAKDSDHLLALEALTEQLAACPDFDALSTICLESLFRKPQIRYRTSTSSSGF